MDNNQYEMHKKSIQEQTTQVTDAASDLYNESKKLATDIYKEGCSKVSCFEQSLKEYTEQLANTVQENPLTAILIAGGVGYLLAKILK